MVAYPMLKCVGLCALLVLASPAWAQGYDPYGEGEDFVPTRNGRVLRNQIDLDLLTLVSSSLSLRYERSLNRWLSLAIHPQWWWGGDPSSFDFGLTLQLRFYLTGHAMHGLYISPQVGYFQVTDDTDFGDAVTDRGYLYAVVLGYDWIIARAISLYLGAGFAYTQGSNDLRRNSHYPLYVLGPFPVFEIGIGVPF